MVALTPEQISEHSLASIAAKPSDSRFKDYVKRHGTSCWELDALDPRTLREILKEKVEALIDWDAWARAKDQERDAKREFEGAIRRWAGVEDPIGDEIQDAMRWS